LLVCDKEAEEGIGAGETDAGAQTVAIEAVGQGAPGVVAPCVFLGPDGPEVVALNRRPRVAQGRPRWQGERDARRLCLPRRSSEVALELREPLAQRGGDIAGNADDLLRAQQEIEVLPPEMRGLCLRGRRCLCQLLRPRPHALQHFRHTERSAGGFYRWSRRARGRAKS